MRRKQIAPTPEYQDVLVSRGPASGNLNDCGIVALCLATGADYVTAHKVLTEKGYTPERGAPSNGIRSALRTFGYRAVRITVKSIVKRYPPAKQGKTVVTPRQVTRFPSAWQDLPPILLWNVDHVAVVKDGKVHDWSAGHSLRCDRIDIVLPLSDKVEDVLRKHGLELH